VKADRKLGARLSPRQTHAYAPLKRAVRVLSTRAIDRRTRIGKALQAWRSELISDLGGIEQVSAAKLALVDAAVKSKLILDSIEVWIFEQPTLVNKRTRGVLPIVLHRNGLVSTLRGLLVDLGLDRRAREVPALGEYLNEKKKAAESRPVTPPVAEGEEEHTP
jgi:hypothetical protein